MSNNNFIDITDSQTHSVVHANKRLILHVVGARAITMNGVALTQLSHEKSLWIWHTQRKIGRHIMTIFRDNSEQHVIIECIAESMHHETLIALRNTLMAIDVRLCAGQSALQANRVQHAVFATLIGMSVWTFIQSIERFITTPQPSLLSEWHGDVPTQVRMDRLLVQDSIVVPMAYYANRLHHTRDLQSRLLTVLQALEPEADACVYAQIQQIRRRLLTPIRESKEIDALVTAAYNAVAQSQRASVQGELQQTADIALLYERWVWVVVLHALGCTDAQVRNVIDSNGVFCGESGVMCAYQRRLAPTPDVTGWSRDGRVAVPDVLLWQVGNGGKVRGCVIDAKCSFDALRPDQAAQNDVTAYLRRVGVGKSDPDAAVLVHPGSGMYTWPSGLIELGTDGLNSQRLTRYVHEWVHQQN